MFRRSRLRGPNRTFIPAAPVLVSAACVSAALVVAACHGPPTIIDPGAGGTASVGGEGGEGGEGGRTVASGGTGGATGPGGAGGSGGSIPQPPECDHLLHHWSLDTSEAPDTVGGLEPFRYGNPSTVPGVVGNAMSFDGVAQALRVADGPAMELPASFTIEAFVRVEAATEQRMFLSRHECGSACPSGDAIANVWLAHTADGLPLAHFQSQDQPTPGEIVELTGATRIDDGAWHHLALVRDADNAVATLYVDGVGVAERTNLTASQLTIIRDEDGEPDDFYLGAHQLPLHPRVFTAASLDEVGIYGAALSPDVMAAHAAAVAPTCSVAPPPDPTPPVLHNCVARPSDTVLLFKGEDVPVNTASSAYGLLVGGATFIDARVRRGFDLTAPNAVLVAEEIDTLDIAGDFTLTGWFRVPSATGQRRVVVGYHECGRLCASGDSTPVLAVAIHTDGTLLGELRGKPPLDAPDPITLTSTTVVDDGAWHHFALIRNTSATRLTLVVDGDEEGHTDALGPSNNGPLGDTDATIDDLLIGGMEGVNLAATMERLGGYVDEIALIRRALTPSELNAARLAADGYCF